MFVQKTLELLCKKKGERAACCYDETGACSGTWTKYKVDLEGGEAVRVFIKKTRFTTSRFLCNSFRCMNRRAFFIQSATYYAEKKCSIILKGVIMMRTITQFLYV
jgi:hypothetical protein